MSVQMLLLLQGLQGEDEETQGEQFEEWEPLS